MGMGKTLKMIEREFIDTALDAQMDTFFLFEPATGKALRWNKAFRDISGYTDEEISMMSAPASYYSPENMERANEFIQNILEKGSGTIELELICKGGRKVPTEYRVSIIKDDDGNPKYLISIGRDVTERKRAMEALKEERDKAQKYLDLAGVIFVAINTKGEVTLINQKGSEILGYGEEEIIGMNWFENFLHKKRKDEVRSVFHKLMAGIIEPVEYYENSVITKRGEEKIIAWHNTLLKDDEGKITGTLSSGEDITDRKHAEDALKKSEETLSTIIQKSPIPTAVGGFDGSIISFNEALETLIGYKKSDMNDTTDWAKKLYPNKKYREFVEKNIKQALNGDKQESIEFTIRCKDGSQKVIEFYTSFYQEGLVIQMVDTTEHKKAEREIIEQKNMSRFYLDLLIHDIGNIHQSLYGNVQLSKMTSDPGIINSYIGSLETELVRSMTITRNLTLLARINERPFDPKLISIQRSIEAAIYRLKTAYPTRSINIISHLDSEDEVLVDENIDEVFYNLFHNAVIFQKLGDPIIEIESRKEDKILEIDISDHGSGMPDELKEKVLSRMDPTKGKYQRGIGLALVRALMERYGGSISVNDRVEGYYEKGAKFTLFFPR